MTGSGKERGVSGRRPRPLTFHVLGSFTVKVGDRVITPTAQKRRQVLALLLLNAGKRVSVSALISELWDFDPPRTAKAALHTYLSSLRRLLADATGRDMREIAEAVLATDNGGYTLNVNPDDWDGPRFEDSLSRGQESALRGDFEQAEQLLQAALAMCQGDILENVTHGPKLYPIVQHLAESRLHGESVLIDALIHTGKQNQAVRRATTLAARHPHHEGLHTQLMRALYAVDRRADALEVYRRLYVRLQEELGVAPAPRTSSMYQMLLQDSPDDALLEELAALRSTAPARHR